MPWKQALYTYAEVRNAVRKKEIKSFGKKKKKSVICDWGVHNQGSKEGAFPWFQYFLVDLSKTKPNIKYHVQFLLVYG